MHARACTHTNTDVHEYAHRCDVVRVLLELLFHIFHHLIVAEARLEYTLRRKRRGKTSAEDVSLPRVGGGTEDSSTKGD